MQQSSYLQICGCNGIQNHNHLVRKQILTLLDILAKWLSVRQWTKWMWVRIRLQSLKLQISRLFRARSSLIFKLLQRVDSLWNAYVVWQEHSICGYVHVYKRDLTRKSIFCSVNTIYFMQTEDHFSLFGTVFSLFYCPRIEAFREEN